MPAHGNRDVAKGTLRGILNDVSMTIDELAWSDKTTEGLL